MQTFITHFLESAPELFALLFKMSRKRRTFFLSLRARVKCTKMRHYHKELCKREQLAKTRNLELLRSAESLVLKAKEFSVDYTVLHHLKVFFLATVLLNDDYKFDYKSWNFIQYCVKFSFG